MNRQEASVQTPPDTRDQDQYSEESSLASRPAPLVRASKLNDSAAVGLRRYAGHLSSTFPSPWAQFKAKCFHQGVNRVGPHVGPVHESA